MHKNEFMYALVCVTDLLALPQYLIRMRLSSSIRQINVLYCDDSSYYDVCALAAKSPLFGSDINAREFDDGYNGKISSIQVSTRIFW
jgi:hypothetical protein